MRNSKATETWFQIRLLKCFLLKHNTVQARSYCMCICTSAIKCVWVRAREDKKEEVKKKKTAGRTAGLMCVSVRRKGSSPSSCQGVLSWQDASPWDDTATGANGVHLSCWHIAASCVLPGNREALLYATYECLRARQICHRVQRESQPPFVLWIMTQFMRTD